MRVWDRFRRPPPPESGPLPAARVQPAWPDLPPLQRVVSPPSLVTAPERFRADLASWANPSFLGAPGHLVATDAPSGSIVGVSRPAAGATEPAPVQRAVADQLPERRLPVLSALPATGGDDLVTARAATVPEPVWRPAVPAGPAGFDVPFGQPDAATPADQLADSRTPTDGPSSQRAAVEVAPAEEFAEDGVTEDGVTGDGVTTEVAVEDVVPARSEVPLPVQAPPVQATPVQAMAGAPSAPSAPVSPPAIPLSPPRRRLGLGAPVSAATVPPATGPAGGPPDVARLLDGASIAAVGTGPSRGTAPASPAVADPSAWSSAPTAHPLPPPTRTSTSGDTAPVARPAESSEPLVVARLPQEAIPLTVRPAEQPEPETFRLDAERPPSAGSTATPVSAPAPDPVGPPLPPGVAPAAVAQPVVGTPPAVAPVAPTPAVQRHPTGEEVTLAEAAPVGLPDAEDAPVQRAHEAESATPVRVPTRASSERIPLAGSAAGQQALQSDLEPSAVTIAAAGPAEERPLVARSLAPLLRQDRRDGPPHGQSSTFVVQRSTTDVRPKQSPRLEERPGPRSPAEAGRLAAYAPSSEETGSSSVSAGRPDPPPWETDVPESADLVGEWPIVQLQTDAAPELPNRLSSTPGRHEPAGELPVTVPVAPVATLPAPAGTQQPPLGERPIVLRAFAAVPPSATSMSPMPASPSSMARPSVATPPALPALGVPSLVPPVQRLAGPDGGRWFSPPSAAGNPAPRASTPGAMRTARLTAPGAPVPRPVAGIAVQALSGPSGGEQPEHPPDPQPAPATVSRLADGGSGGATTEVGGGAIPSPPSAAAGAAPGGASPAVGGLPAPTAVDELVHRLFDPFTRQFKAELRLDRERVGHALDLRY